MGKVRRVLEHPGRVSTGNFAVLGHFADTADGCVVFVNEVNGILQLPGQPGPGRGGTLQRLPGTQQLDRLDQICEARKSAKGGSSLERVSIFSEAAADGCCRNGSD